MSQAAVIDYSLSLSYAVEKIEAYKEFDELIKVVDKVYLWEVLAYQKGLQSYQKEIHNFVTDDYNVVYYLIMDRQITSFEQLKEAVLTLDAEQLFQLISRYVLDCEEDFTPRQLLDCQLSDDNRWRLTELYYNFEPLKETFCQIMDDTWAAYSHTRVQLVTQFAKKIAQEELRLAEKSDDLYQVVYQDYITKEYYLHAEETTLLLLAFQKVVYFQKGQLNQLSLGLYAYDYFHFVKELNTYNQDYRNKVLKTLADPTRFGILKMINDGIYSNKIMAEKFFISSAAISYQLKYLMDNQIIKIDETSRHYKLNKELLLAVLSGIEKELFLTQKD